MEELNIFHGLKLQERMLPLTMTFTPMQFAVSSTRIMSRYVLHIKKNARLHRFCPHTPSIKSYMGEPGHLLKVYEYCRHAVILLKGAALGHGIDILGQSLFLQSLFLPCIMHSVFIHLCPHVSHQLAGYFDKSKYVYPSGVS